MTKDAIVVSRGIAEEGVGSNAFIPTMNIAGRETRTKMLAERKACRSMGELSSGFDGLLDMIGRDPAKVGTKKFQVGSAGRKIVLVDAKVVKQARNGSEHRLDSELLATAVDDEVNVIREVPGIATGISGMRVKIQGTKVKGCVESKVSRQKFVVHGWRVPDSVSGQKDVREWIIFRVGRRAHVNVGQTRTVGERDMIAARSDDALETAVMTRSLVDESTKRAELSSRMNGVALSVVGILVHDGNNGTAMGLD
jgi:hypothetical protein